MKKHKLIIILVGIGVAGVVTFGVWYSLSSVFGNDGFNPFGSSNITKQINNEPNSKESGTGLSSISKTTGSNNEKGSSIIQEYKDAKKISPYVSGWIYVAGTDINYPVMAGRSSEFWLTHHWTGKPSIDGSIFLGDGLLSPDNNVILINGHNMANGTMFANLLMFSREGNFFSDPQDHRIYIYDGSRMHTYQVFSVFFVTPEYQVPVGIQTKQALKGFAQEAQQKCIYKPYKYNGGNLLYLNTCNVEHHGMHQILVAEEIQ